MGRSTYGWSTGLFVSAICVEGYLVKSIFCLNDDFLHSTVCAFRGCVAASIILNDVDDDDIYGVAYVMCSSFALFSIMGYLTGTYIPLLRPLRGLYYSVIAHRACMSE